MPTKPDIEHALLQFILQFNKSEQEFSKLTKLSDGSIFVSILKAVENFQMSFELREGSIWMNRLVNLRNIIDDIEKYYESHLDKGIKTRDIDLVALARENQIEEVLLLFEVVLTVLMSSTNKQDFIKIIMNLDEKAQRTFVELIKTNIEKRQLTVEEMHSTRKSLFIQQLQIENNFLREELLEMHKNNEKLQRGTKQLEGQVSRYEDELKLTKDKYNLETIGLEEIPEENEKLKLFVRALKEKLLMVSIDHETESCNLKEEINNLQAKLQSVEDIQETINLYKEKYQDAAIQINRYQVHEKEKSKLNRMLEEKDNAIQKLQARLSELIEKNFAMEEAEVYMRMELQKKDVRFKELEKEVRNRLNINPSSLIVHENRETLSDVNNKEDFNDMKNQLEKNRSKAKELERQNRALTRKAEKSHHIELQNKKLERMIHELTQSRNDQIKTLLIATYQLRNQNVKMHEMLQKSATACSKT